jgi:hypothetical protein
MNTRAKFTVVALLSGFALASNPAKADVLGFSVTLPSIGAVTAEVSKVVAADLTASLRSALSQPRVTRTRTSPTVTVQEMETVMVVATRLPPATESLAQANSTRTRL